SDRLGEHRPASGDRYGLFRAGVAVVAGHVGTSGDDRSVGICRLVVATGDLPTAGHPVGGTVAALDDPVPIAEAARRLGEDVVTRVRCGSRPVRLSCGRRLLLSLDDG